MPENGSAESAPFRQYPSSHGSWWVDDDHHTAVAEEILYIRKHDVIPSQSSIRAEMRLNFVLSLLINCNVGLARLELDQRLDRGNVHPILFENRQLFPADLILSHTGQQVHFSLSEDPVRCDRNILAFSVWDSVELFYNTLFPRARKSFVE